MLPRFFNARFLLSLPFAIVADLLGAWVAGIDAKYAGALGGDDDLPCEVHVPGRDAPSSWCAACRMSGAA